MHPEPVRLDVRTLMACLSFQGRFDDLVEMVVTIARAMAMFLIIHTLELSLHDVDIAGEAAVRTLECIPA